MSASTNPQRRTAVLRALLTGALVLGLTGCTLSTSTSADSSSAATASPSAPAVAAPAGATVVVTVPGLPALSATATSAPDSLLNPTTSPGAGPTAATTRLSTASTQVKTTTKGAPTAALTTSAAASTPSRADSSSSGSNPSVTATAAPATLSVRLANCADCTVLGTHAAVTSTLGAALVATGSGRAALLSLRADGSVAGVGNVVYGTTFPTQGGGQLACDSGGRCIVIAQQSDGTAIASAYQVSAQGVWSEVTGQPGIVSVTAKAQALPVGDGVGVAVQDEADGSTVWIVYGWEGDGYGVKGCTAAATPEADALTMDACLS